ncbi:SRSF protein kinase 1 isoform X2 [Chelonia mydas]|uniref:SRSF protein kinase 1 isoform X2 n=2 Tax=Chelonia mydas TaxID=8469 RepID=UPI0018A221F8|nr:SRSF protein kinase 1 isoform X2 [Chelonia mydas]XP_037761340.1 SRSF protein kinase 1 isoform X2 [Chelonia mydas]XP_043408392.1 SRSF protein kinase 1 isoform X2 [Chelonia mydas]
MLKIVLCLLQVSDPCSPHQLILRTAASLWHGGVGMPGGPCRVLCRRLLPCAEGRHIQWKIPGGAQAGLWLLLYSLVVPGHGVSSMKKKDRAGKNIIHCLDDFKMIGANGFHVCLVFELLGPSLRCLMRSHGAQGLPLPFVKKALQEVLAGLQFLHTNCRIIHTDIKPENILLQVDEESLQKLLHDTAAWIQSIDVGLKKPGILANQLDHCNIMKMGVKIADLGSACWTYKPLSKEIQTQPYRALEVLLGLDYSTPADIWSTACLAFEMATGNLLFEPQAGKYFSRDDDHVARIIELLGRIPPKIAFSWKQSSKFFSGQGALLRISRLFPCSLYNTLMDRYNWTKHEAAPFTSFLLPMLEYIPAKRTTALKCLQHPWLSNQCPDQPCDSFSGDGTQKISLFHRT